MPVPRREVMRLYKDCILYINSLKYSDKTYLKDKVKQEFRKVAADDDVEYYYEKGKAFWQRSRFI